MDVERRRKEIVVNLTRENVFDLQKGNTIYADRPGITTSDATLLVSPLSNFETDNSGEIDLQTDIVEKAMDTPLKGYLYSNEDLEIFIPKIDLLFVNISSVRLPRKFIKTPGTRDQKFKRHMIPPHGVLINFTGAMRTINIPSFFA